MEENDQQNGQPAETLDIWPKLRPGRGLQNNLLGGRGSSHLRHQEARPETGPGSAKRYFKSAGSRGEMVKRVTNKVNLRASF